jgi:hypothetical protein
MEDSLRGLRTGLSRGGSLAGLPDSAVEKEE